MNILLTSAGRRTYLVEYFKKSLKHKGLLFASNSYYTHTLAVADGYVIVPPIYSDSYSDFILRFCIKNNISAIIPLLDADAYVLSKYEKILRKNKIILITSSSDILNVCNDKWLSYKFLNSFGISQPRTYIDINLARKAIDIGELVYPIIIKPRWGIGSFGIYTIDNDTELQVLSDKLRKDIFKTYLGWESANDINGCILYQQRLEGDEFGIEILNNLQGTYVATFAKKKVSMRAGETDIAETVDINLFEHLGQRISCTLKHVAMLDCDCIVSSDGIQYIIEMNCRFGGQYPFTHNAGVDVPTQIVEWLEGNGNNPRLLTQRNGVKSCKEIVPVIM